MRDAKEPPSSGAVAPQSYRDHGRTESGSSDESLLHVLLVDPEEELSRTRSLLLGSLGHPVEVARSLAPICHLPRETRYCLVAVSLHSKLPDLPSILTTLRSTWPAARILLLGKSATGVEDYQYDELVDAAYHPADLVEVAQRLISARPFVTNK